MTDVIGFAKLISYITALTDKQMEAWIISDIHNLMVAQKTLHNTQAIDRLLQAMKTGQKIEAIRQYRALTGEGFKESKDAVERYWTASLFNNTPAEFR